MDERADRLREIEERAKRDLGMTTPKGYSPDDLRGAFSASQSHRGKRRGLAHGASVQTTTAAAIVLLLLMIAYCLLA